MSMKPFASLAAAAVAALSLGIAAPASAQSYPEKPVTYIIPFGPGGESDINARPQQAFNSKKLDQELVIEFKPGGGRAGRCARLNTHKGDGYNCVCVRQEERR